MECIKSSGGESPIFYYKLFISLSIYENFSRISFSLEMAHHFSKTNMTIKFQILTGIHGHPLSIIIY
jgi:hypothetical protein